MLDDIKIKWKSGADWVDFPVNDILHLTRDHAIALFTRKIPVIIRQGDNIISNDTATRQMYHKRGGCKVIALDKVTPSSENVGSVGFV